MRRKTKVVSTGAVLALAAGVVGGALLGHQGLAAANDVPPSIEEDFSYPNAAAIKADRGITLLRGDGNITLVDCGDYSGKVRVRSNNLDLPSGEFCFQVRGEQGWLTLELRDAYQVRGDGESNIDAKVTVNDVEQSVDVPLDAWANFGVASGQDPAVLVELRATP
ncbi:hypothetical protein ACGFNF_13025 [Micromonospora sp. NPDC048868]|uniref:hypothetical protein n=1 Tax=Micromonospora sp. NPDC048868 TaxID=3364258 RepID=UPI00371FA1F5